MNINNDENSDPKVTTPLILSTKTNVLDLAEFPRLSVYVCIWIGIYLAVNYWIKDWIWDALKLGEMI